MATLNKNIPQSLDSIAFEGGYDPTSDSVGAKELDSVTIASSTTRGPLRVVVSALNGIIGPAAAQPTTTNVGTDTSWSFTSQVRHLMIQNNTSANVQFSLDVAATAGSPILTPGATFFADIRVTAVHLLTAAAQNINGTSAGNIIVWGWS
jgi:hypothetical protein